MEIDSENTKSGAKGKADIISDEKRLMGTLGQHGNENYPCCHGLRGT